MDKITPILSQMGQRQSLMLDQIVRYLQGLHTYIIFFTQICHLESCTLRIRFLTFRI